MAPILSVLLYKLAHCNVRDLVNNLIHTMHHLADHLTLRGSLHYLARHHCSLHLVEYLLLNMNRVDRNKIVSAQ